MVEEENMHKIQCV